MFWTIFGTIIFLAALLFLFYLYRHDRFSEKGLPSSRMSDEVWDELAKEREEAILKARKFKEALKRAKLGERK